MLQVTAQLTRYSCEWHRRRFFGVIVVAIFGFVSSGCSGLLATDVRDGEYPEDWNAFKERNDAQLVTLPTEASVTSLRVGSHYIDIRFSLPDEKSPPEWLVEIAASSGFPDKRAHYLDATRKAFVPTEDSSSAVVGDAIRREWAIGFVGDTLNHGYLRYYPSGVYEYWWTND